MLLMNPIKDAGRAAEYFGQSDGGYYLDGKELGVPAPTVRKPTLRNPCGCQSVTTTSTRWAESAGRREILRKIMAHISQ